MSKIKIVTDSACDISYKNEDLYDIEILPFQIVIGDDSYTSRVDFDNAKFFELMEDAEEIPKTSQITAFEFGELYGDLFEQGYTDVIYVSINSEGSATYYNSVQAKDQFFEDNPDAKDKFNIYCIDSKSYSVGYGYPVTEAAKMADKGVDACEIVKYLRDWFEKGVVYFGLYTLKYAKKSGRIPSAAAFVGELLGLRPILKIFDNQIVTDDKVRGDSAVIPAITKKLFENIEEGSPYCVVYGNDSDLRDAMAAAATEAIGYPPADFYQIGAAVAANAGPEVAGVAFKIK